MLICCFSLPSSAAADVPEAAVAQAIHNAIHMSRDAGEPSADDIRKWKKWGTTSHGVGYITPGAWFDVQDSGGVTRRVGLNLMIHFVHNKEQVQRELQQFAVDYIRDDSHSGAKIYASRLDRFHAPSVLYYYKDETTHEGREVYVLVRMRAELPTHMRDISIEEAVAKTIERWRYFYDEAVRLGVLEGGEDYWVEYEWDPHNPMVVRVTAKQKIDGNWRAPNPPAHIGLIMNRTETLAANEAQLLDAYKTRTPLSHYDRSDKVLFMSPPHKGDAPYYSTASEQTSTIDLRQGLELQRSRAAMGGWTWDYYREYWIHPPSLARIWESLLREATSPDQSGKLVADVQVELYRTDEENKAISLASSATQKIYIDHIAEIHQFNTWNADTLRTEVFRPQFGTILKPDASQMSAPFSESARPWLLPNDKIILGPHDGVRIFFILNQEEWIVRANPAGFGGIAHGFNQDRAEVYIYPTGGPNTVAGVMKWGLSGMVGIGVSVGVSTWLPGVGVWTSATVAGATAGLIQLGLDGYVWPEDLVWTHIEPDGTKYGLEMTGGNLDVYLFEGKIKTTDTHGNERALDQGEHVRVSLSGTTSVQPFNENEISESLADAVSGAVSVSTGATTASVVDGGKFGSSPAYDIPALKAQAKNIRFFEMGAEFPSEDERDFAERFPASKARRIGWHINLDYPSLEERKEFAIHAEWRHRNGVLFAEQTVSYYADPGWTTSYHSSNWGWDSPGNWAPGAYTVTFFCEDQQFAQKHFEIQADKPLDALYDIPGLKANVSSVRFFEGQSGFPPLEEREFRTQFAQSDARRIYWHIDMEHLPPAQKEEFTIYAEWRKPGGELLAEQNAGTYIDTEWKSSYHSFGWGWDEPGNWKPGVYRLEFYINGNRFAEGSFEITSEESKSGKY